MTRRHFRGPVVGALLLALVGAFAGAEVASAACASDGMPSGTYGAYVKGVQQELPRHGYDAGKPTGRLDARTQAAIRQYQRDARLPVDGCVTKTLLDHLQFHLPKVYARGKPPAPGLALEIQQELVKRGYYLGNVDGRLGPRTKAAIERFQKDAGMPANGTADRALLEKLRTADAGIRAR